MDMTIRPAEPTDDDGIWEILAAVIASGETFAFTPETNRDEALASWTAPTASTYVAAEGEHIVGPASYLGLADQPRTV